MQCAKNCAGCSRRHGFTAGILRVLTVQRHPKRQGHGRATAGPRQCYEVTLLWCPKQSRRNSIVSISSLESLPSVRDLLASRAPPEVPGPSHARNSSASGGSNHRSPTCSCPKPAANTAHKRQISEAIPRNERPVARQVCPETAEGDAREGRHSQNAGFEMSALIGIGVKISAGGDVSLNRRSRTLRVLLRAVLTNLRETRCQVS